MGINTVKDTTGEKSVNYLVDAKLGESFCIGQSKIQLVFLDKELRDRLQDSTGNNILKKKKKISEMKMQKEFLKIKTLHLRLAATD